MCIKIPSTVEEKYKNFVHIYASSTPLPSRTIALCAFANILVKTENIIYLSAGYFKESMQRSERFLMFRTV
jgi:hypothetical protein